MPLNPFERLVVLGQIKELRPQSEIIKNYGARMSKWGRLTDDEMFALFEALRTKANKLEDMALELAETGILKGVSGAVEMLIDKVEQDDQATS